jgi:carbonic anhydrase
VEVDLALETLDHSGFEALASWCDTHRKTGGTVRMEPLEDVWACSAGRRPTGPLLDTRVSSNNLVSGGAQ